MTLPDAAPFRLTRLRPGYAPEQVDAFLATIAERTVEEINNVVFRTTRFMPGYDERQVDAYLDACIARKQQAQHA